VEILQKANKKGIIFEDLVRGILSDPFDGKLPRNKWRNQSLAVTQWRNRR
jgi:hypothetical protein